MIDLKVLPTSPGIYIYRDKTGKIIYIGKAVNLKKRVTQYFQRDDALGPKTQTLVSQIDSIETRTVGSEIEALILESKLIKKHHPKYNSQLKDDRSYIYICLTREKIPRVFSAHSSTLPSKADIFGPFPDGRSVNLLLKTLRRLFPYYGLKKHPPSLCLYCHLHLCPGPAPSLPLYRQNIKKIKAILNGNFSRLQHQLQKDLRLAIKLENFETAIILRDQLASLVYITSGWSNLSHLYEKVNLPDDESSKATTELQTVLSPYLNLSQINRLECYDISQLGTKYFVGSMVVWQNGQINHNEYRQFRIGRDVLRNVSIKRNDMANDPLMLKEIVYRRLKHPEWQLPDLIIVDGGKPQVSSVLSVVETFCETSLQKINVIGLAKKFETIVIKNSDHFIEINLPQNSTALRLLQNLRNEAHRFANRYRKKLISKSLDS